MPSWGINSRSLLLSTVSVLALIAAAPETRAADLPRPGIIGKAPAVAAKGELTWWAEGGAFATEGGSIYFGDPSFVGKPLWGWEGAVGVDYRYPTSVWHFSAQLRFGEAKKSANFSPGATFSVPALFFVPTGGEAGGFVRPGFVPIGVPAHGFFDHKEDHWLADFAVGRDVGLGVGQADFKAGFRVAEIWARTSGPANFVVPTFVPTGGVPVGAAPGAFSFQQESKFSGVGPRLGIDGTTPIAGGWTVDWLAGVAVLFSQRQLVGTATVSAAPFGITNFSAYDFAAIFNLDAQAGLSYWFMPSAKLTLGYRFDGYWGALKTINAVGAISNVDRFFYGPMARLTVKIQP